MLAITTIVGGCKKPVYKDVVVDLSIPEKIGSYPDLMESRQMCPEATVLWPVQLQVEKTGNKLNQYNVEYAEVILSCGETECVFHINHKKGAER